MCVYEIIYIYIRTFCFYDHCCDCGVMTVVVVVCVVGVGVVVVVGVDWH